MRTAQRSSSPTTAAECRRSLPLPGVLNSGLATFHPPPHLLPSTTRTSSDSFDMEVDQPPSEPRKVDEVVEPGEKLDSPSAGPSSSSSDIAQEKEEEAPPPENKFTVPSSLAWIPANFTWTQLKPVIRCSLTAWVSLLCMILPRVARPLGQVGTTSWCTF